MKETELNKVLNYMKQYVENKYEHDSEPMLTYKDLQLVLEEIERLHSIIKEAREYIEDRYDGEALTHTFDKDNVKELLEILQGDGKE